MRVLVLPPLVIALVSLAAGVANVLRLLLFVPVPGVPFFTHLGLQKCPSRGEQRSEA